MKFQKLNIFIFTMFMIMSISFVSAIILPSETPTFPIDFDDYLLIVWNTTSAEKGFIVRDTGVCDNATFDGQGYISGASCGIGYTADTIMNTGEGNFTFYYKYKVVGTKAGSIMNSNITSDYSWRINQLSAPLEYTFPDGFQNQGGSWESDVLIEVFVVVDTTNSKNSLYIRNFTTQTIEFEQTQINFVQNKLNESKGSSILFLTGDSPNVGFINNILLWQGNPLDAPFENVPLAPITNSSWNVTSGNVLGNTEIAWNTGNQVNLSSDLLTFSVETNINTNMSCRLDVEGNYTSNVLFDSQTKSATTNTTDHSLTLFQSLSVGDNSLYCDFINEIGEGESQGGSSLSSELLIFLDLPLALNLIKPINGSVNLSSPVTWEFFASEFVGNCSLFLDGVLNETLFNVSGIETGTWNFNESISHNTSVDCEGTLTNTHFFSVLIPPPPGDIDDFVTGFGECPADFTNFLIFALFIGLGIFFGILGFFLDVPAMVYGSILMGLPVSFILISCNFFLGLTILLIVLSLLVATSMLYFFKP